MKRILITGLTGYIGSNLARSLLPDCEIYGLVRKPLNLEYIEDIASEVHFLYYDGTFESMSAAIEASRPDLVYHLAAYYTGSHSAEHVPGLIAANITLGAYLLGAMSVWKIPALVYATTHMTHYQGEQYRPLNLYAATKRAFSDLLAYYTDTGMIRAAALVISDTYGPNDHRPKVLNRVKQAARTGEKMAFSSGEQSYDVVYIDDVVSAFQIVGKQLLQGQFQNDIFQIVPESPLSLRETVEKMLQVNGLTLNAGWGERPAPDREMTRPVRLYPTPPGWKPQVPLDIGLKQMVGIGEKAWLQG